MSTAELKQLFRPFAQASAEIARRYGGAGLGLFLRQAHRQGDGRRPYGRPARQARGSTFRLTVLVEASRTNAARRRVRSRLAAARSLSILCAEDNPYGRVVMNTILRELGHRVDFVETGEAAVEAVARGGYDAVLMDVTLAGLERHRGDAAHPRAAGQGRASCR